MRFFVLSMLMLVSTLAFADVKDSIAKIDHKTQSCLSNPDNQSTAGTTQCTYDGYQDLDRLLNTTYNGIVDSVKNTEEGYSDSERADILKRLEASEQAWVAYRSANSNLQGVPMIGGSGQGLLVASSYYEMTKARILELDRLFH